MNFGLVAHRLHRQSPNGALLQWARLCAPDLLELGMTLQAVGGAHAVLSQHALIPALSVSLGAGRRGGLMRLVARVAGAPGDAGAVDGVFFFVDPLDPTSIFPEALALKRQCVIHGKPFVATLSGALEWVAVLRAQAGLGRRTPDARPTPPPESQVVALIAHDALKPRMTAFAAEHFDALSRFAGRVATGSTGRLLNDMAWSRGWPQSSPWVTRYQSGPLGGDAQIAELVLDGRCNKVVFFEDPHVARQHEADIQLLDRAVCTSGDTACCFNTPTMAGLWAAALQGQGASG